MIPNLSKILLEVIVPAVFGIMVTLNALAASELQLIAVGKDFYAETLLTGSQLQTVIVLPHF